eukprot:CAMPEP_0172457422 /NCGR_PEP_ID=MMETSP1065-20121228/22179_1 /TAXON_ID=265537 /ORGANISM="Amphiprora paludosa, Strain CCMP125" /LENGTH=154 /DNA_ID=CAMNT_0013211159 /DNA_START=188 /DNA_END=649 /DNA_ORIENTATION=+
MLEPDSGHDVLAIDYGHGAPGVSGDVPLFFQVIDGTTFDFEHLTPDLVSTVYVGETRYYMDVTNRDAIDHNHHQHGFFFQHISTTTIDVDGSKVVTYPGYHTIRLPRRPGGGGSRTVVRGVAPYFCRPGNPQEEDLVCAYGKDFDSTVPRSGGW